MTTTPIKLHCWQNCSLLAPVLSIWGSWHPESDACDIARLVFQSLWCVVLAWLSDSFGSCCILRSEGRTWTHQGLGRCVIYTALAGMSASLMNVMATSSSLELSHSHQIPLHQVYLPDVIMWDNRRNFPRWGWYTSLESSIVGSFGAFQRWVSSLVCTPPLQCLQIITRLYHHICRISQKTQIDVGYVTSQLKGWLFGAISFFP